MYRHSPVRNPRSKGIKTKNVLQVCLLIAVCFWLIFQVKRSHDKKKEFDSTKISSSTNTLGINDEVVKLGRKDIQPKLEKEVEIHEENEEQDEEHEEQDEEKIDEEKDDGGGGGDDEIDENEQEKSDVEVDHEEMGVVDEESGEKDAETQTENVVSADDHEEDGATVHTHEGREEHYKADDASSAVVTHLGTENGTLDNNSSEEISIGETVNNGTSMTDSHDISIGETVNNGTSMTDSHENGPPSSTTMITSESTEALNVTGEQFAPNQTEGSSNSSYVSEVFKSNELNSSDSSRREVESDEGEGEGEVEGEGEGEGEGENLESNDVIEGTEEILDPDEGENETHLEDKEVRMDLDTLPEIETEGGNSEDSEDTAVERR